MDIMDIAHKTCRTFFNFFCKKIATALSLFICFVRCFRFFLKPQYKNMRYIFILFIVCSITYVASNYQPPAEIITEHLFAKPHLGSVSFNSCPLSCDCTLTTVDCADGGLTGDLANILTNLPARIMHLNLFNNDLTSIPVNFLRDYTALRTIDLRGNKLTSILKDSFQDLPALKTIYLSFNKIVTIEPGMLILLLIDIISF